MTFVLSKWFVGSLEFFGSIVPGAIILYLLRFAAVAGGFGFKLDPKWPSTNMEWATFLGVSFILGRLAHPLSHPLNILYDRTYRQWRGDPLLGCAQLAAPHVGSRDSVYAWAKSEVSAAKPKQALAIDVMEGISKMFRTLALLSVVASVLAAVVCSWVLAAAFFAIALLSFLVFSERRFAAAKEVCQSLRRIKDQPSTKPSEKRKQPPRKKINDK
jgi:hypothetical protein